MLPPKTPNYGKTPKYIEKYREEAKVRQYNKDEERAAKNRPPGTRLLEEPDRISTLEALIKNKAEVLKMLTQLPISMRTENLKR